jgi:hypothetical protein
MISLDFREDDIAYILTGLDHVITELQGYLQEAQKKGYYTLPDGKQKKCDDGIIVLLAHKLEIANNMYGYVNYKVMMGGNKNVID